MAPKVRKYMKSAGNGSDVDIYEITGLSKLEALSIQSALRLARQNVVEEIRKTSETATMTDEGKIIEDLTFLGGELQRVCMVEFMMGEEVEL